MKKFDRHPRLYSIAGSELQNVCIGRYIVNMHFDNQMAISEELKISVGNGKKFYTYDIEEQSGPFKLHRATLHTVKRVEVTDNVLQLIFDHGLVVGLYTEEGPFECCNIYFEGGFLSY